MINIEYIFMPDSDCSQTEHVQSDNLKYLPFRHNDVQSINVSKNVSLCRNVTSPVMEDVH